MYYSLLMFTHNSDSDNEGLVTSLFFTVASVFSCCTKSKPDEAATYVQDTKPSQTLPLKEKGMFAASFEQIPCNGPIYDYQYRTGRRYVSADNFPRANDLDAYLARQRSLLSMSSCSSLDLATEANLDFHILADQFVDLFSLVTDAQLEELRSVFPNEVAYFLEHGERLTALVVKQEFTQDGSEDLAALSEIVDILRGSGQYMHEFLSVLSQTSGSRCSSVVSPCLPEVDKEILTLVVDPELTEPATTPFSPVTPANLKTPEWFETQECSDVSDSGEDLQLPVPDNSSKSAPVKGFPDELVINIESSLASPRTPLSASKVQVKHQSAVAAFEEWAALQSSL